MKTKIRAIINKLRGIEDDLIDLLGDSVESNREDVVPMSSKERDSGIDHICDMLDSLHNKTDYSTGPLMKDNFHELSEMLAKANGIHSVGKSIHYNKPTPIRFSVAGRIDETEIPILDEERIEAGFNLDFDDLKVIPHVPQVDDLLAALKVKDHPDWFKQQKADEEARRKPHDPVPFLPEAIEAVAPLTPEEIEQQITKVTHLKEIANQYAMMPKQGLGPKTVLQKLKVKHLKSKCDAEAPKPAKPVTRVMDKIPSTKNA